MEFKNLKKLDNELSPEIKLLVPLTIGLLLFSFWFRDIQNGFFLASLFSLILVLFVDFFLIVPRTYPKVWNTIKWLTLAIIVLLTLIGNSIAHG